MSLYKNEIVQNDLKEIVQNINNIDKLKNSSVLITGATGMLATYVTSVLIYLNENYNYNIQIYALLRTESRAKEKFGEYVKNPNFHILLQDVTQNINIENNVDYIIHSAGSASPHFILNDPVGIIKANTIGTMNVMDFAKDHNVKNVLYTSTREVYGKVDDGVIQITEDLIGKLDQTDARACYPESKRMGENICKSYQIQYGVPFNNVRIAHSYGPGMTINNDGRVMSDFIYCVVNNKDIELNSDGTAKRAFCYINDAITAMFEVLLNGENGESYNIANETEEFPIKEVAQMLTQIFAEKHLKVTYLDSSKVDRSGYSKIERVKLSTKKLEDLGWKPQIKLQDGLERTVRSFE
jgi:nucleoside-diphosphate-sugar epimerase